VIRLPLIFALLFATTICSQDIDYVKKQAEILSSHKMKGRGYVDNGLECAAKHISKEFKKIGLKSYQGDYYQSFHHKVNTFPDKVELTVDHVVLKPGVDFIVDSSSPLFAGRLKAKLIDLSDLSSLPDPNLLEESCDDCILILDVRQVTDDQIRKDAIQLKYLYSQHVPVIWLSDAKRTWSVSDGQSEFPVIETSSDLLKDGSLIEVKIDARFESDFESKNIIGYISGTSNSDSIILFTAHYDHLGMMGDEAIFYGANDNASGTAFIMSLAKHYIKNPSEYTCVFIAFAGEEAGLKGSKFFVENSLIDLEKIRFVINLDLMGSGIDGITVVNAKDNATEFDLMSGLNEELELLPAIKSRGQAANSDHYYFAEAGVPAIFIYALGGSKAYHDVFDVSSNLTFDEYSDIFKLLTHLVEKL
jgi:hypothetical protein